MALEDYPFRVEELSPAGAMVRVIAYLDHPIIAKAAFRAAVEQYPKIRIRLRNRAPVRRNTSRNDLYRTLGRSRLIGPAPCAFQPLSQAPPVAARPRLFRNRRAGVCFAEMKEAARSDPNGPWLSRGSSAGPGRLRR